MKNLLANLEVLLYRDYRTRVDLRPLLCRWPGLYGQCGSKRNESTGTGFALLPGVGHRLPDRDALEWLADRPFP